MPTMKNKKQQGFALIEVLLAALVMIVGGVGYMKLQRTGLQYSYNNNARIQGLALSENLIEQLRGNVTAVKQGLVRKGDITAKTLTGDVGSSGAIINNQFKMLQEQMRLSSPKAGGDWAENSRLCFLTNNNGFLRVTYLWKDNSAKNQAITCPAAFNDNMQQPNMVSLYAQL
ncbi:MAG: hypothetical protein CR974_02550 [Gammaproteobacteria bacterium]|nr:MAG: hypothetical protein CR974_02550 [Gammaproteobacteria bacterium]